MESLGLDLLLASTVPAKSLYIVCRNAGKRQRRLRVELFNRERSRRKVWVTAEQGWSVANVLTVIDGGQTKA